MYIKTIDKHKIDPAKLSALKLSLPHGALMQIARELDITRHAVEKVFAGKWENDQVIDMAIQIIEDKKSKKGEIESRIDQALNN